jgi:hypothetical protein
VLAGDDQATDPDASRPSVRQRTVRHGAQPFQDGSKQANDLLAGIHAQDRDASPIRPTP